MLPEIERKYYIEERNIKDDYLFGGEECESLEEAKKWVKAYLDYAFNNIERMGGRVFHIFSVDYDESGEEISKRFYHMSITTEEYYEMDFESREKLFNKESDK